MKSILFTEHGDISRLQLTDIPLPEPGPGEVRVRLAAASVNHIDIWVRNGSPAYPVFLPHIPGADGAGTIDKLGHAAEGVELGQRVTILPGLSCETCPACRAGHDNQCSTYEILGAKRPGTYAEYVCVPDRNVMVIPGTFSFEQAAAYPLAYLTAWHLVVGRGNARAGETVVVTGAGSGVGVAAIQIAKLKKARVLAVTSSSAKSEALKRLGADDVVALDQTPDFHECIMSKTGGRGADLLVEHVGPATWEKSLRCVARCGRIVTCGATTGPVAPLDLRTLFSRDISILGGRMGTIKEFRQLSAEVFGGRLAPTIDAVLPLERAAEAHARMEERRQIGKIVLKID